MIVQPIVAALELFRPLSLPEFAQRFAPVGLFALLWFVLTLQVYVRGPIALYRMNPGVYNPSFHLVTAGEAIDAEVQGAVLQAEQALVAIGFAYPQRVTTRDDSPLSAVETLLEHPANGDLANVDAMIDNHPLATQRFIAWVAYRTDFADGSVLYTANLEHLSHLPVQPGHHTVTLPKVRDPVEVYRIHRARVARMSPTVAQVPQSRGSTPEQRLEFATTQWLDSTQFQISCGYRKRSTNGVRLTARGATLSAWRRLFPWKQITAWQARRAAAEVLRLG